MKRNLFIAASFVLAIAGAIATKASTKATSAAAVFFKPSATTCVLQPECSTIETNDPCAIVQYYSDNQCTVQVAAFRIQE